MAIPTFDLMIWLGTSNTRNSALNRRRNFHYKTTRVWNYGIMATNSDPNIIE